MRSTDYDGWNESGRHARLGPANQGCLKAKLPFED
jgi:hypothetical protein